MNEPLETGNTAIIFVDHKFRLRNFNKEAANFLGIHKMYTIGRKADAVFKKYGDNFLSIFKAAWREDLRAAAFKIKIRGKYIYVHADSMKLRNDANEFIGIIITIRDISSLSAAIKQIKVTQMLMSLGELAAGVAHHVRTPLTTISGYLQIMLTRLEDDKCAVSRNVVETLLSEVSCINNVVKELILFAKPPINKTARKNVNYILEDALFLTFKQMGGEKIEIKKNLAENLPLITADENLLKQALVNVMQNALESMPDDGILSVGSRFDSESYMIIISIADTGSGVPNDILTRLCEPFYTTKLDRMGLGLPVAQRIVNEHGGFLAFHTSYRGLQGTTVRIYLPAIDKGQRHLGTLRQEVLNLQ
jgi:two-component system sensor histidine kinase AtoS